MKKILFTDLDGTLLDERKAVSSGNRRAVDDLLAAGNYFVIATGRPVASALDVARALKLDRPGCYLVACNGGALYEIAGERLLKQQTLPLPYVSYLFEEARGAGLHIQTYQDGLILAERSTRELADYVEKSTLKARVAPDVPKALMEEPYKVLLSSLDDEEALIRFQQQHREWERGKCNSFFSSREYLEYCPAGVDKGAGIRQMAELLGVPLSDTWAAGDERNDIPMLLAAGTGVAMANGHPDAKAAAAYVTKRDNDHDGIAEVVEVFGLDR